MQIRPIPEAPIEGAGLFFEADILLVMVALITGILWILRNHPIGVLALLAIVAPLTEEVVFEAGVTWSLPILLLLGTVALLVLNPVELHIPRKLAIWIGAFIGLVLFSTAVQFLLRNPGVPVRGYPTVLRANLRLILLFTLFTLGISVLQSKAVADRSPRTIYKLVWVYTGVSAFISTVSILWVGFTYAGVLPNELATIFVQPGGVTLRLSGTNSEPSQFGTYLTPSLFLSGGLASQTWPHDRRPAFLVIPIALATALSYSTSAMLMLFGALVVAGIFFIIDSSLNYDIRLSNLVKRASTVGIVAVGVLLLVSSISTVFVDRTTLGPITLLFVNSIGKLLTITQSQRFDVYLVGVRLFSQHPIIGTGFGTHRFYAVSPDLIGKARGPAATVIGIVVETGISGLGIFIGFLGAMHRIALDSMREAADYDAFPITFGAYLAFTSIVIGFIINTNLEAVFTMMALIITTSLAMFYQGDLQEEW
jgi:hypothetical protein